MEPNQIPPNITPTPPSNNINKILLFFLIIVSLLAASLLTYILLDQKTESYDEKGAIDPLLETVDSSRNLDQDQKSDQYSVDKISDLSDGIFEMSSFQNTKFKLTNIYRIEGLEPGKCEGDYPEEVEKIIRFAGCHDANPQEESLIGIDIKVENNGTSSVEGDILIFGYFFQEGEETRFRIADLGTIPFSSYYFRPFSEGVAQLHFWIPKDAEKVYMVGGKDVKNYNPNTTTTSVDVNKFESKILIDFTESNVRKLGI